MPPIRNEPMFAAPAAPELKLSQALAKYKIKDVKGTYSAYHPVKRVSCWECVNCLHEANGKGDPPRAATTVRTGGGERIPLRAGHAEIWRRLDGRQRNPTSLCPMWILLSSVRGDLQ